MATMYPAIEAGIGRWTYYIVKMKISDLAREVNLSSDVHQERTLDEAIQRKIQDSRAREDLVAYLHDREDRFLNSIVVAALGGSPTFTALQLADSPENTIFKAMQLDQSFGVLTFAGGEKYYALDGQHRLAAIRAILQPTDHNKDKFAREYISDEFRQKFGDEEISVIMVVQDPGDDETARDDILKDYRRLFSSLNRYAKATDQNTNIIMDEDDGIAILTRRLIADHEFFKWTVAKTSEYSIVKTDKGKNLSTSDPYFTQIEVLYDINQKFLESSSRTSGGWKLSDREVVPHKDFKKLWRINRPDENVLDGYYEELVCIWDALFDTLPDLRQQPSRMRVHNPSDEQEDTESQDHALFWPIGQYLVADVIRALLDEYSNQMGKEILDKSETLAALAPLKLVDWSLHSAPWRHLLLVLTADRAGNIQWTMRNEGRNTAVAIAKEVLLFIVGLGPSDPAGSEALRIRWTQGLSLLPDSEVDTSRMWEEVLSLVGVSTLTLPRS